jgi:DNA-binding transcriptional LysR family regulator
MSPKAIGYFIAVARSGSFRRAAEALHVAPSAINRQIRLFERDMGVPLFERSRGRLPLRLTPAGAILLEHARIANSVLDRARSEIEGLKGLRIGTITIGAPETFTQDFLPEFLNRFHERYPGITFRVMVGLPLSLVDQLLRDDIEVALVFNPPVRADLRLAAEIEMPTCIMVTKGHPLAQRRSVRVTDCVPYPLVMPEHGTRARIQYDEILGRAPIRSRSVISTNSYEMMRSAARVGLGIAIVSDYLVTRKRASEYVVVPIKEAKPSVLACCSRTGRRLSVAAEAFIEAMREQFKLLSRKG